jgi:DNA-binding CsgD family transcriptional regulator
MRQGFEEFSHDDIARLKLLEPLLSVCLQNALLHNENRRYRNVVKVFEEQTNSGIIILNSKKEPIYDNQQAQDLLGDMHRPLCDAIAHPIEENISKLNQQMDYWKSTTMIPPINFHLQVGNRAVQAWMGYLSEDQFPEAAGCYAITFEPSKGQIFNHKKIQSRFLLTKREVEIIDGIFRGLKNMEIGEELFVGETTVKKHVQNICAKMGIRNRTAIIYKILKTLGIAE